MTKRQMKKAAAVLAGTAAIGLGVRLEMVIPGIDVPQTVQTPAWLIAAAVCAFVANRRAS